MCACFCWPLQAAVQLSAKLYGDGHMIVALSHQALARAMMVAQQFTDEEYFEQALKAWRIAIDAVPGDHPRLALFRYTLGMCG